MVLTTIMIRMTNDDDAGTICWQHIVILSAPNCPSCVSNGNINIWIKLLRNTEYQCLATFRPSFNVKQKIYLLVLHILTILKSKPSILKDLINYIYHPHLTSEILDLKPYFTFYPGLPIARSALS